ncbi:MAG: formate dehydrogenase accessory sulfurtransferase FdhD [Pseudomonadota bacterium]
MRPANIRRDGSPPAPSRSIEVVSGDDESRQWAVPEETPVAFLYNGRNYAVMLASPRDFADFAIGFSLTERVVDALSDIQDIDIRQSERGTEIRLEIAADKLERLDIRQQRRNLVGRAGCGVCGLENAETFFEPLPRVTAVRRVLNAAPLQRALRELRPRQPLHGETRTVHAAAWAGPDGGLTLVREDVGRHNALDKLLGALVSDGTPLTDGFVLMSSRCSYEIIEKAARLGVTAVASVSGPTAFAVRKAAEANIALYCRDGEGFVAVNTDNDV